MTHFDRFNSLARNGWLGVLSGSELALWHAYEVHASPDGIAYPDGATLAEMLCHASQNHVGHIRQRLVDYGLIEVLNQGGGRGRKFTVRVLVPPLAPIRKPSRTGNVSEPANLPESGDKPSRIGSINLPESGDKPSRIGRKREDTPYVFEQTINRPIEQTKEQSVWDDANAIYESYPRKVGKPAALRAIQKCLKVLATTRPDPVAYLLERTRSYAEARASQDPQFTPHPATWFNQERYNDDPQTWRPHGKQNGKHRTAAERGEFDESVSVRTMRFE